MAQAWKDMSYTEQRAVLGLWDPPFSFHLEIFGRRIADAFQPMAEAFQLLTRTVNAEGVELAYNYALARGDDS